MYKCLFHRSLIVLIENLCWYEAQSPVTYLVTFYVWQFPSRKNNFKMAKEKWFKGDWGRNNWFIILRKYCLLQFTFFFKDKCQQAVWPDWALFWTSWQQTFLQKEPKYCGYFKYYFHVKRDKATFWAILGKFGQLFTPSSGHTANKGHNFNGINKELSR